MNTIKKMVTINIQKKDMYLIGAILVFIMGAGIVIATGGSQTTNGHDYVEIGIPTCTDNQVLKWSGGKWNCGSDNAGGVTYSTWSFTHNPSGNWEYQYIGANRKCFTFVKDLMGSDFTSLHCTYNSNTGNVEMYSWSATLVCGYVCLD